MSHAIGTTRYKKRSTRNYSSYVKAAVRGKNNNWQSVIIRKVIIQSLICILIVLSVSWLKGQTGELAVSIITKIKHMVVERNVSPEEIYGSITGVYEYIKGGN